METHFRNQTCTEVCKHPVTENLVLDKEVINASVQVVTSQCCMSNAME